MTDLQINEEVLTAYLRGELNAAEAAAVEAWYDASAANRRLLGEIYYILYVNDRINDTAGIDVERSLRQFKRRMHAGRRISLRRITLRAAAAAAVAVILLAGGVTTVSLSKRLAQPLTVITHLGERSQVVLPDGTKVWLNSASSVEYVAPFFSRERRVKMDGEAYFEVAKDANRPFIVHTDHFATRVLGTSFDVTTAPRADGSSAVVLVEGSVAIDVANGESVTLNPSERFSMKDGSYSVYEVDPYKYISWKDGLLFFTSNTLFEVLQKVAAFYKIEITCFGEIGSRKCTGKLILFDDLDGTLDVLSDIFRIAYVRGPDGSVAVRPAPDDCADAVYR